MSTRRHSPDPAWFDYPPATLLGILWARLLRAAGKGWKLGGIVAALGIYLGYQGLAARLHALDYTNDLVFWDATRKAVPNSAKAHLNYSVMLGARGNLEGRLVANEAALRLAPKWPMASVYEGDTLCRMHRAHEAIAYYLRGFDLGPNDMSLIALGLQCLWDEHEPTGSALPLRAEPFGALASNMRYEYPASFAGSRLV